MLYRSGRDIFSRHPHLMTGALGSIAKRVPLSIRHGSEYRRVRRLLERSQWWSREELAEYQLRQLRQTVEHAYRVSPYYREKFDRAGVRPEDLRALEDIRHFPTLTKDELRENLDRMVSPEVDRRKLMDFCTGGTTGPGVVIPFEEKYRNRCRGFVWHLWDRIGYQPKDLATFLQHRECPPDINDGLWYMEKPSNAMVLSAQQLSPKTIPRYLEALQKHKPRVLIAYPSLAYLFASYAKQAGWNEKIFDLVILSSETLYEFQRRELEEFFQARVRIHYAHIESCALFGYCEHSNVYHVQMEYGFTEFLREDGSPAASGEVGEIVATNFENRVLPLVRYHSGDLAEPADGRCECGRAYPLVEKIHGRKADLIHAPSGAAHSPIVIEVLMDKVLLAGHDRFADLQIVQTALDKIVVRVEPGNGFVREDVEHFCRLLDEALNHEIHISMELVEEIPRTERQKKCLVVSTLSSSGSAASYTPRRVEPAAEMSRLEQPGLEILARHRGVIPHFMTADRIWASRRYELLARDNAGPWQSLGRVPQPGWRRVSAQSDLMTQGLRLGVHGIVRLASGALLVCVGGGLLRGGEGEPWQTVMEFEGFRKPARQGLAKDRKGRIFLAQYARNHNRAQAMHLWRSEDDGRSFQVLRHFKAGEVRHLHFIQEDPIDGSLWLGTGDRSEESSLQRSTDGGETWDVVGRGSQKWRAMGLAFREDDIYYGTDAGTDSPEYQNQIVRLDRHTGEAVEVRAVQGPVHGVTATREGGLLIATAVEGGGNETDDSIHVWHSPDGDDWREVASWPAGSQPRRVQYGLAQFVRGQAESSNLCIVLRGVRGMPLGCIEARLR